MTARRIAFRTCVKALYLDRGDPDAARELALGSFPILHELRTNPDA